MSDFKLFGQTIPFPLHEQQQEQQRREVDDLSASCSSAKDDGDDDDEGVCLDERSSGSEGERQHDQNMDDEPGNNEITDENQMATSNQANENSKGGKSDQSEITSSTSQQQQQDKTLKKPDKILPCPRCNSMETKFCYYNNYNVNQPRHFCKNCQRYWTAGGTMRNVPVGAGRRKNKAASSSASQQQYNQILVSEALRSAHHQSRVMNGGSTVLSFRSDPPLCESVASILNISDNAHAVPHPRRAPVRNADDCLSDKVGFSWPFAVPPPGFCPPGYPISFYATPPYWGCAPVATLPWNGTNPQCVAQLPQPLSPKTGSSTSSSPATSPLGKHCRDGEFVRSDDDGGRSSEKRVVIPKTLRIDDPNDAAKSSIWATLGISKSEKPSSIKGGDHLFQGFQSKGGNRGPRNGASLMLQANPAAMSRSLNFRENN